MRQTPRVLQYYTTTNRHNYKYIRKEVPFTNTHNTIIWMHYAGPGGTWYYDYRQQTNDPVTGTFSIFYTYYDLILFVDK